METAEGPIEFLENQTASKPGSLCICNYLIAIKSVSSLSFCFCFSILGWRRSYELYQAIDWVGKAEIMSIVRVPAKVEEDPQIPSSLLVFSENPETHDGRWGNEIVLS